MSRVGEKFYMVVGDLKTSVFAGGEPAGVERSCQLVDTCDVKLCDVASCVKGARVFIGCEASSRHDAICALSADRSGVSGFAKIVEFWSHFGLALLTVCGLLTACFCSAFESSSQSRRRETSDVNISLAEEQFREVHCSWNSDGCRV